MSPLFWLRIKHPLLWPSVSYGNRKNLPRVSGFYAVSSLGWIWYIGLSNNINRRWNAKGDRRHHRTAQVIDLLFPRIHFIPWPESRLKRDERRLIDGLKPTWNDTAVPKRKWSLAELVSIGVMGFTAFEMLRRVFL